jgi:hypothetical protein
MSKNRRPGDYTVGYGRPPEHTRFKPGQGGDPAGRRRSARQPVDVAAVLNSPIEVQRRHVGFRSGSAETGQARGRAQKPRGGA